MKKYYAYIVPEEEVSGVADNWPDCQRIVAGKKGARYRGFATEYEAREWLEQGARYEQKVHPPLEPGIYFDSGTGRGLGFVEIKVTDERGRGLLDTVLDKKDISKFGTHMITDRSATNNFGELLALKYALMIAMREGIKQVFGDSKLVIDYWSKGHIKKNSFSKDMYELVDEISRLRKQYELDGGQVTHISGDINPADLGFHK